MVGVFSCLFLNQGSQCNVNKYTNAKNEPQGLDDDQLVKGQKSKEMEGKQDGHRKDSRRIRAEERYVFREMKREVERQVIE